MAPPNHQTQSVAVLVERLSNMQTDVTEICANIGALVTGFQEFRQLYLLEHASVVNRTEAHEKTLVDHGRKLEELEKDYKKLYEMITPLIHTNKIVVWIGAVLGLSVLGLIWSIITGQVVLVFK